MCICDGQVMICSSDIPLFILVHIKPYRHHDDQSTLLSSEFLHYNYLSHANEFPHFNYEIYLFYLSIFFHLYLLTLYVFHYVFLFYFVLFFILGVVVSMEDAHMCWIKEDEEVDITTLTAAELKGKLSFIIICH
jgi:hypothetical protein